jgi:hypothetical protein
MPGSNIVSIASITPEPELLPVDVRIDNIEVWSAALCADLEGDVSTDIVPHLLQLLSRTADSLTAAIGRAKPEGLHYLLPAMQQALEFRAARGQAVSIYFAYRHRLAQELCRESRRSIRLSVRLGEYRPHGRYLWNGILLRWNLFCLWVIGVRYWSGSCSPSISAAFVRRAAIIRSLT